MNNAIFTFFFELSKNPFIREAALVISYQGTYIILVFLFAGAILFAKRKFLTTTIFFSSVFLAWITTKIIKILLHVDRPFLTLDIIPLHLETGYSFPSTHSAIFAAVAICMFAVNKKFAMFLSFFTLLIGFSRIIIGVHYPTDVLAGFIVGAMVALVVLKFAKYDKTI